MNADNMDLGRFNMSCCILLFALVWVSNLAIDKMCMNSTEHWNLIDNNFGLVITLPLLVPLGFP